ncbi:hypothetical protein KIN20_034038 [Parelaphostrongylus tenuis]|uniref:Uncharacterized protein n=1 Tax=Parelaphostrongylus tenuis TaxID=148309 RepID=A0AAD5R9J9_PARTN|nr:hypothetical protein KIN20_034038 [Parelaphostrongylus tenuis]
MANGLKTTAVTYYLPNSTGKFALTPLEWGERQCIMPEKVETYVRPALPKVVITQPSSTDLQPSPLSTSVDTIQMRRKKKYTTTPRSKMIQIGRDIRSGEEVRIKRSLLYQDLDDCL